ncbi:putative beta-lysine N-acetyltransferase [Desulfotomaculum copahuensis]|uniref:Putative beta-lysine N-acetyltransferase n=1 Tax=Desulfotomaculum copahuensis TaxID=1838280 RepID=A0A1B7LAN2_9FIRM|nr:putative beta-lysine N-acetyltransferase [Desulfotomaculum copahuensis]OAT79353.1 putative beta-lysine N-acetyltransferase [Desulfotomaculum copahuensis]
MDKQLKHRAPGFRVSACLDRTSERLWVTGYEAGDPAALRDFLKQLAISEGLGKIILPVRPEDLNRLQGDGFKLEGTIDGYFQYDDGHFLAAFPRAERSYSPALSRQRKMLAEIRGRKSFRPVKSPPGFTLRRAGSRDIPAMAAVFRRVFATYPAPVYDPGYLAGAMNKGDLFMVFYHGRRLVSVAAAEIDSCRQRAELTNCATDPAFRGMGLSTLLLRQIERACLDARIGCLYSLARASSFGMNLVFHRLGYRFGGTLINNCHIAGDFEDMNIWVRPAAENVSSAAL